MPTARLVLACVLLTALAMPLRAEEEAASREVQLPRERLSVRVPSDWTLKQYGHAVLEVAQGPTRLWFYRAEEGDPGVDRHLARVAEQAARDRPDTEPPQPKAWRVRGAKSAGLVWYETSSETRVFGAIDALVGRGLHVEGIAAGNGAIDALKRMLATVCVEPFANAQRHVDWNDGWTIDLEPGWRLERDERGQVRCRAPDASGGALRIDVESKKTAGDPPPVRLGRMIEETKAGLAERGLLLAFDASATPKEATLASTKMADGTSAPTVRGIGTVSRDGTEVTRLYLEALLIDPLRMLLAVPHGDADALASAQRIARTFRAGTHPGPRVGRFARADAPAVAFTLPQGWVLEAPSSGMRAGQVRIPGDDPLTVVVYFFGAGKGGTLDQNRVRWLGQMETESEPIETKIEGTGIAITLLDASGTYVAETRPGSGQRLNRTDQRMLAAYLEVEGGPLFFKLVGAENAIDRIAPAFRAWLESFRPAR